MAFRRNLTIRARIFAQQRFTPSISYLNHNEDRENQHSDEKLNRFLQSRSYGVYGNNTNTSLRFRDPKWSQLTSSGFLLTRNMSSSIGDGGGIDKIEYMGYMTDVLADKTMEVVSSQAAPVISEVAVAAADSWLPVAALQYAIDGIHNFTGLNWWASIVITTLVIRTLTVPVMINQMKASAKLAKLQPELEKIKSEMNAKDMSPKAVAEGQEKMKSMFKENGVSPFSPLKGMFIQGPVFVSFFLAIQNMVEKVPSFQTGGMSWFLDLTTPDTLYILPVVTALSFWITVECNMQQGMEGNANAGLMKNVSRGFAVLTVPLTLTFPKALFCYWITANFFSLVYGQAMKQESVMKLFNIPKIVPPPPPPGGHKPAFSFWEGMKKYAAAQAMQKQLEAAGGSKPVIPNKILNESQLDGQKPTSESESNSTSHRVSLSSSVLSNRIKSLEKQVKGRKKNKRR